MKQFIKTVCTTIIPLWLFIMIVMYYGVFVMKHKGQPAAITTPVNVEYFKAGDTLYPDYACPDTLIVTDAAGLNKAMAYLEQDFTKGSDSDIDSTIHIYCIDINK